jgi:fluoroacetyl-CoA thioesterase
MTDAVKPGMTYTRTITVGEDRTISFMGDDLRVYATPHVVSDLEYACRDFIKEHLPDGQDSVGAHVEIRHLKPTPLGMEARHELTVSKVEGRNVTCDIEVFDALEKVATASHTRFVVDIERLKRAIAQKRDAAKQAKT